MNQSDDTFLSFLKISQHRMIDHYLPKFVRSIGCLSSEELWRKESEKLNSIGGIVLHVLEHLNRHIARFSDPNQRFEQGIETHFPTLGLEPEELSISIQSTFQTWNLKLEESLTSRSNEELHRTLDMHSIYHLVEHTGYHLGQVVDRAQRISAQSFSFCQEGLNEKNLLEKIKSRE